MKKKGLLENKLKSCVQKPKKLWKNLKPQGLLI